MPPDTPPPEIPPLPGINVVAGMRRMMNKTHLYEKVLRDFHARFRAEKAQLEVALASGDLEDATRRAHSAKGLAGSIGAEDLQAAALALEMGIREGSGDLEVRLERFCAALAVVLESIAAAYGLD